MSSPLRVLILEDRQADARLMVNELTRAGFAADWKRVETESDFLAELDTKPEIILADYSLPQFDAIRALRLLRERDLDIPFIIVSGSIGEDLAVTGIKEGADDYLLKDRLGRLGSAVTQALAQRQLRDAKRRAERALRESEQRTRLILDTANDAFITMNGDGRVIDWNTQAEMIFGWPRGEILGQVLRETIIPPKYREAHERGFRHFLATGESSILNKRIEIVALNRNGHEFPVELTVWPVVLDGVRTFTAFVRDITERKLAEMALRRSEERYRNLFEISPRPMWVYDLATFAFLAVNEAAVDLYGYSHDEFLAMTIKDIHPPEDDPALIENLINTALPFDRSGVWRHRARDGRVIDVEIASHALDFGEHQARLVVAYDVTERKLAEAARERLIAILEATPDLVAISQMDGAASYINAAGRRTLGLGPDESVFLSNARPDSAKKVILEEAIPTAMREGVWSGETVLLSKNGEQIPVSQVLIAHRAPSGTVEFLSTIARDIRSQKLLEEQFRQSQKMEAIGRLAGGVAHDFNNLLTIINGYGEILIESLRPGDPLRDHVEQIKLAGDRASALTRQLLAFSRKQVLVPVVLDLNALLADMAKMLRRLIGEDIDLRISGEPRLWRVKTDPGQMEQVILNLAVNARDAMPRGGKLTIETANVDLDESYANGHMKAQVGQYMTLSVSDTGCGMSAETKAHIFEPFFTTKGPEKGSGLGLATVYGIVQQSGGHVEAYSELNVGSTFKVYLPRVQESVRESKSYPGMPTPRFGTETLLLVEDEDIVRKLALLVLQKNGYTVLEARDGGEALLICEQYQGPIKLMVTDVIMPKMSGPQLADRLHTLRPEMRVLYLSGYTDDAIVQHGVINPDTPFLQKPYSTDALARKVRQVLDQ